MPKKDHDFKVLTLNNIAIEGRQRFPQHRYTVGSNIVAPDAILVRTAISSAAIPEAWGAYRKRMLWDYEEACMDWYINRPAVKSS